MGRERAIEEGSGAPKSLLAKASVGTEDMGEDISFRAKVICVFKSVTLDLHILYFFL